MRRPVGWLFPRRVRGLQLLLLAVVLVPVLLVQAGIYSNWLSLRRQAELQTNLELARAVGRAFEAFVRDLHNQELAIGLALAAGDMNPEHESRFLLVNARAYPSLTGFSWVDPTGRVIASSRPEIVGANLASRADFQQVLQGGDRVVSDLVQELVTGVPTFTIVRGIRVDGGDLLGVVVGTVDPRLLDEVMAVRRAGGGVISLIDSRGWAVYRYPGGDIDWDQRDLIGADPSIARTLAGEEVTTTLTGDVDGLERMISRTPLSSIGWIAVASRPAEEVVAPVVEALLRDAALFLAASIMAFLAALLLSRSLTSALARLQGHAVALALGKPHGPIDVRGPAELEDLARTFNRMAREIEIRDERQAGLVQELSDANWRLASASARDKELAAEARHAEEEAGARARQQAAVAELGQRALSGTDLPALMDESVVLVARTLGVEYAKVLELLPGGQALLLRAGVGWKPGLVGRATVSAGLDSQAGFTLACRDPVIVEDLQAETRFAGPALLYEHGVVSGMSVIIAGPEGPFGVLGTHTTRRQLFTNDDFHFLQAVANVLASAIQRKRVEEELARSRDQLQVILDGVADGITAQDTSGRLVYANDAAARQMGFPSAEALLATPLPELMDRFRVMDEFGQPLAVDRLPGRRALQGLDAAEVTVRFQMKATGDERWSRVKARPVFDADGKVRLAINIFRDVSEQWRAEQALRQSEAKYRSLYGAVAVGIVVHGADGLVVDANERAQSVLGLTLDQMQGLASTDPDWRAVREDGAPFPGEEHPAMVALRTGQSVHDVTMGVLHPDGERRWLLVNSMPTVDPGTGAVLGSLATFVDITERKRAEESQRFLAEATAILASSLDYEANLQSVARLAVPQVADWCAIDLVNEDGAIELLVLAHGDPARLGEATELWRNHPLDPDHPHGVPSVLRAGRPEIHPEVTESMLAAWARDVRHRQWLHQAGLKSAMLVPMVARGRALGAISLMSAESNRRYGTEDLALAQHLARRAALAVDNARLYRQAREAVEIRNKFLSSISHDLKNPLAGIKGMAQLLRRQAVRGSALGEDRLLEGLTGIDETVTRMSAQIDELLDVARLQMGQPLDLNRRPTDLVTLVREAIQVHHHGTDRHRLVIETTLSEAVGMWDRVRLARVLGNLVGNAIKYSPQGGDVTVSIALEGEGQEIETGEAGGSGERPGRRWAVVVVRDRGLGIPAADLPHIFDGFRRAGNVVGRISGTGIGLSSARQIVELHGGTITVTSEEWVGSTFTVRLPLDPPVAALRTRVSSADPGPVHGERARSKRRGAA